MASRPNNMRRFVLLVLLGLGACTAPPPPPPAPLPPPSAPPPAPLPADNWREWPLTAGTWRYIPGNPLSSARYGIGSGAQFVVQCDAATRRVTIMRAGTTTELAIIMSTRTARLPAGHIEDRGTAMSGVLLNASDRLLDEMLFSRGRIGVTSPGLPSLALPAWAEPARAVEDCRK